MTADRHRRLGACRLYLIATLPEGADPAAPPAFWWTAMEASVRGGAGAVQLRAKDTSTDQRCRLVAQARQRLGDEVLLLVNDDLDAALCDEADGVHLGREDAEALVPEPPPTGRPPDLLAIADELESCAGNEPLHQHLLAVARSALDQQFATRILGLLRARMALGEDRLIGTSTRTLPEIHAATRGLADHLGYGAMCPTTTKQGTTPASPLVLAQAATALPDLPIFPIGGLGPATLGPVLDAGVGRAAVGSALLDASDPWSVARELVRRLADSDRHRGEARMS
jgi:thiamine monophosphate synthase